MPPSLGDNAAPSLQQQHFMSGRLPVFSAPVSCGKGNRPGLRSVAASLYRLSLLRSSILLLCCRSPEKVSCPIPAACSGVGTLLRSFGTFCLEVRWFLRCFPAGVFFSTVILFSRCCPSMNYPKSNRVGGDYPVPLTPPCGTAWYTAVSIARRAD